MPRYFKNPSQALYMQVSEGHGFAVRVLSDGADKRFESYTFSDRTMQYIADALAFGNVVEIEAPEYRSAAEKFITWASNQVSNNIKI
ncbi:MAG: hypothetical protein Q8K92_19810 [Leadbetterella sp.]|nr:hypothetical protein [Leadbetterella sp.]